VVREHRYIELPRGTHQGFGEIMGTGVGDDAQYLRASTALWSMPALVREGASSHSRVGALGPQGGRESARPKISHVLGAPSPPEVLLMGPCQLASWKVSTTAVISASPSVPVSAGSSFVRKYQKRQFPSTTKNSVPFSENMLEPGDWISVPGPITAAKVMPGAPSQSLPGTPCRTGTSSPASASALDVFSGAAIVLSTNASPASCTPVAAGALGPWAERPAAAGSDAAIEGSVTPSWGEPVVANVRGPLQPGATSTPITPNKHTAKRPVAWPLVSISADTDLPILPFVLAHHLCAPSWRSLCIRQ
jgi:hypothetical protein